VGIPERIAPVRSIFLVTLREHVHESLREAIIAGRLPDGERLNERDMARDLGVSTTPLKEALRQLESEGLVRTESRRGVFVTFGAAQAEEMSLARAALESMIARMAAKRAVASDLALLRSHVADMQLATEQGNIERLIELNELFHGQIHQASGCSYLRKLQSKQQIYNHRIRAALLHEAEERRLALAEHTAIFNAIIDRDSDAAERFMRDHIVRSGQRHIETVFGNAATADEP
jgi:DNA-binding GntR family transcriptional regulator